MIEYHHITGDRGTVYEFLGLAVEGMGNGQIKPYWRSAGEYHIVPLAGYLKGFFLVSRQVGELGDIGEECFEIDSGNHMCFKGPKFVYSPW